MISTLNEKEIANYLTRQLDHFFPDENMRFLMTSSDVEKAISLAYYRIDICFKALINPAFSNENGESIFSHIHSDQYTYFLYFFMNSLWENSQNRDICDRVMYLNRIMSGMFVSYKCKLPTIFFLGHPVGTVLGNAHYSDYLIVTQNCTVNTGNPGGEELRPKLGKGLYLAAGSKIIGDKCIGDYVTVGIDTVIHNRKINDRSIVYKDENGKLVIKDNSSMRQKEFFRVDIFE